MRAVEVPEILHLITPHLLSEVNYYDKTLGFIHLKNCAEVSKLWRATFLDCLWHTVDDCHPLFLELIQSAAFYSVPETDNPDDWSCALLIPQEQQQPSPEKDHEGRSQSLIYSRYVPTPKQRRAREVWDSHQHRIRALHAEHYYTVDLALESGMAHLLELKVEVNTPNELHKAQSWQETLFGQLSNASAESTLVPAFDPLDPRNPPRNAFKILDKSEMQGGFRDVEATLSLTRACWRLVLNNPGLVSLTFGARAYRQLLFSLDCEDIQKGWSFYRADAKAKTEFDFARTVFAGATNHAEEERRWRVGASESGTAGMLFMAKVLETLKNLEFLHFRMSMDDCAVLRLLNEAGNKRNAARGAGSMDGMMAAVRSYVYASRSLFPLYQLWYVKDPLGLRYQNCHMRSLDMINLRSMENRHLRLLLELFPCVEQLALGSCMTDIPVVKYWSTHQSLGLTYTDLFIKEFRAPLFHRQPPAPFSTESESFLVHRRLKTMKVAYGTSGLGCCAVIFEALTDLHIAYCRSTTKLWNHLQRMPRLERLQILNLEGQDSLKDRRIGFSRGGPTKSTEPYKLSNLRKIRIYHNMVRPWSLASLMEYTPHLVILQLNKGTKTLIRALATWCAGTLEHMEFNLKEICYDEMTLLMTSCSRLRIVRGMGFMVRAQDMLTETHELSWVCLGLGALQCEIHEVPRLTDDQERILEYLSVDQRTTATGRETLTKEKLAILDQYEQSRELQHRVLGALGQLTGLYHLDIGCQRWTYMKHQTEHVLLHSSFPVLPFVSNGLPEPLDVHQYILDDSQRGPDVYRHRRMDKPVPETLGLSLDLGLAKLSSLSKLEMLGIKALNHRLGQEEVAWMREKWPRLKRVLGLDGCRINGVQFDFKTTVLERQFTAAVPGIEVGE